MRAWANAPPPPPGHLTDPRSSQVPLDIRHYARARGSRPDISRRAHSLCVECAHALRRTPQRPRTRTAPHQHRLPCWPQMTMDRSRASVGCRTTCSLLGACASLRSWPRQQRGSGAGPGSSGGVREFFESHAGHMQSSRPHGMAEPDTGFPRSSPPTHIHPSFVQAHQRLCCHCRFQCTDQAAAVAQAA